MGKEVSKSYSVEVKTDSSDAGEFTALVSVFGNVDLGGDRVMPGAFANTIEDWKSSGKPLPVLFSHQEDNPMMHIGEVDPSNMMETPRGLAVKGSLDLENPYAAQTYKLLKKERLSGFSFGYEAPGKSIADDGARELSEIKLYEVGPCFVGMNPEAGLLAVKSAAAALLAETPEAQSHPRRVRAEKLYLDTLFDL